MKKKKKGTQFDSYSKLDSFNEKEYLILKKLCDRYKIEFMSTPFDLESVDMLYKIGVKAFKIASGDITNFPLIEKIASKKLPIFLSTGASTISEIDDAVKLITSKKNYKICIMHCTLTYPTPPNDANLSAILEIKKKFKNYPIGYSDHTIGIDIAAASILYGVRLIEKHYTYNKKLKKSADHWLSISTKELSQLRDKVDNLINAIGVNKKIVLNSEKKARKYARRSIVLKKELEKGTKIKKEHLICKRPGTGLPPKEIRKIIGKRINKKLFPDHIIKFQDLQI